MHLRIFAGALMAASLSIHEAAGQTSSATPGLQSRLTFQDNTQDPGKKVHKDYSGQPCLKYEGVARSHTLNQDLYDHVVSTVNKCPTRIKVKLCYPGSDNCIDAEIAAYGRKDVVLGVQPKTKFFRYVATEKF
ncbi:hypothetical protein ACVIQY_001896 [Bradyrhizobium sp. USDA 3051]